MTWTSILPPIVAIAMVLWKKEVVSALFIALFTSELLLAFANGQAYGVSLINSVERIVSVVASEGNARILLFSLAIGGVLAFVRDSGGVSALVNRLVSSGAASTPRRAGSLTMLTGVAVFVESNLSVLTAGILARGLFDKFNMSRARLAYIIDSTSAPVCILILLNGWGAYVLALLNGYELNQSSVAILWGSTAFNFYALLTLMVTAYTVFSGKVFGAMKRHESQAYAPLTKQMTESSQSATKARFMLLPLSTLVISMLGFMLWTGNGSLSEGSGSKSVLYATILSLLVCFFLSVFYKLYNTKTFFEVSFKGVGELVPLVTILLFSMSFGASLKELGTGVYVANLVGSHLPVFLIAPIVFLTGAIISFTTGTSWGTFAILIPIAVPLIQTTGLPPSFLLGAVLGGGIFGDHCSPISDTSAVSALASGCDLLDHVRTQLPYALAVGAVSIVLYTIFGLML